MTKKLLLLLIAVSMLAAVTHAQSNGILVDQPKVYDDYYLQMQLDTLKARLAGLNTTDQATLVGKIGGVQGASLQQSSFAVSALGSPTSSANGSTIASSAQTPSVPASPAPSLTMPSSFSPSSLDSLNEEMQLSSQITNLQLLLDGSLNDKYIPGTQIQKRHVTVGFSITLDPPADQAKKLANSLAEVEITLKNAPGMESASEQPSIMTLLPREKTYNVASLVDKSASLGAGGILGGVFNVGAGWTFGKKTYYLVQQQDTLALQRAPSRFAWQFRPVLNRKFVVSGTRQTFVQFAVPVGSPMNCSATLHIHTAWRKLDPKTGLASPAPVDLPGTDAEFSVPLFDLTPAATAIQVTDIGGGLVSATIYGSYLHGMKFRIGPAIFDESSPNVSVTDTRIDLVAPAKDLAAYDLIAIGRDGQESAIYNAQPTPSLPQCKQADLAGPAPVPPGATVPVAPPKFTATATIAPLSDSKSLVTLNLTNLPPDFTDPARGSATNPVVVAIGDQVFGLRDQPFRSASKSLIAFLVPNDLLKAQKKFIVGQLLWGDRYLTSAQIDPTAFPSNDFSVSGASTIQTGELEKVAITGSGLTGATLLDSDAKCVSLNVMQSTLAILSIKKPCTDTLKQVLLANGTNPTLIVSLPGEKPTADAAKGAKGQKPQAKPKLKAQGPVPLKTSKIAIAGTGLDQVKAIQFQKTSLTFALSPAKDSIAVTLIPQITATVGTRNLDITFADASKATYKLTVQKAAP